MCVIAAKHLPKHGWVLLKNRDRNYKPTIKIRKSFRRDIERLLLWDEKTKYTEGVNEFGVSIISASVTVKNDEKEGAKAIKKQKDINVSNRTYYAPDGKRIRTALFEKTSLDAVRRLVDLQICGNTLIADAERCFILEGAFIENDEFAYRINEVFPHQTLVRTNHGILLPWTGYSRDIPDQIESRESSEVRKKKVEEFLKNVSTFDDAMRAISITDNDNPQMNPLRQDFRKMAMRTTGQIILVPSEKTMHYRAIWSEILYNINTLNNIDQKTFFEIVSTRKLISFSEHTKK